MKVFSFELLDFFVFLSTMLLLCKSFLEASYNWRFDRVVYCTGLQNLGSCVADVYTILVVQF